jgi:hypothetical protein
MICYHVRAAQPIGDQIIPKVSIEISDYIPDSLSRMDGGEDHVRAIFKNDAEIIFNALRSLPGGTFDQLLILMLQRTASSFIVAHNFSNAFTAIQTVLGRIAIDKEKGLVTPRNDIEQILRSVTGESEAPHDSI